jgi:tetratricopeptide (TPR) repeat protein
MKHGHTSILFIIKAFVLLLLLAHYSFGSSQKGIWDSTLHFFGLKSSSNQQGVNAYNEEDYRTAKEKFQEAHKENVEKPESQAIALNKGNAEYKMGQYQEAIKSYKQAIAGTDSNIAKLGYYNTGNASFRQGDAILKQSGQKGIQQALEQYRNGLAHYKKTLSLDSTYTPAKKNMEVTRARIQELLKQQEHQQQQQDSNQKQPPPSQEAKEAFAKSMGLVQKRQYQEAKQILEAIIQEDATASSYTPHLKRLEDVIRILEGNSISKPLPQDPRNRQPGLEVL